MKKCKKCGEEKPDTEYKIQNKRIGLISRRCNDCVRESKRIQMAKWRARNPGRSLEIGRRAEAKPSAKANRRAYKANNKEVIKVRAAEYRLKNQDKIKASSDRYREENKETLRERQREWRIANPEDYTAIHSRWKKANKAMVNAATHRRRAKLLGCKKHHTAHEWLELKRVCDYTCLCCGRQEPEISLEPDHVFPLSKGGENGIDNIQPLCESCNCSKHAKTIDYRGEELIGILEQVADCGFDPQVFMPPDTSDQEPESETNKTYRQKTLFEELQDG